MAPQHAHPAVWERLHDFVLLRAIEMRAHAARALAQPAHRGRVDRTCKLRARTQQVRVCLREIENETGKEKESQRE